MQLTVEKCDGSREVYLHTKVMGTLAAALVDCGVFESGLVDRLAESVTIFLKRRFGSWVVQADEIHAMLVAVLADTGYESAALALQQHRLMRRVRRGRVEVMLCQGQKGRACGMADAENAIDLWNKSVIVKDLLSHGLERSLARAVAGMVEECVLRSGLRMVTTALIRELVSTELFSLQQAEASLKDHKYHEAEMPVAVPL